MGKLSSNIFVRIGVSLLVAVCVFLLSYNGAFRTVDDRFCDLIYQKSTNPIDVIKIVDIDEKTMNALGNPSSWDRQIYADFVNNLMNSEAAPSVIAFDILFTGEKTAEGDAAFVEAVKSAGNVVVGINRDSREKMSKDGSGLEYDIVYPYEALKNVSTMGMADVETEKDNYVRKVITGASYNNNWYDCFAIAALRKFNEYLNTHDSFKANFERKYGPLVISDYSANEIKEYRFSYIAAQGDLGSHFSFLDIYEGRIPADFKNGIAFVGAYAPGLQDYFSVPLSKEVSGSDMSNNMYGVEIHANIMQALAEGKIQTDANLFLLSFVYALISGLLCFLMFKLRLLKGGICAAVLLVAAFTFAKLLYGAGIYIYIINLIFAVLAVYVGFIIFNYSIARAEKHKINKAFKMYVAPEIVDEMAQNGDFKLQLGGRNKDIAVLFVDIRGFTTMSEKLRPEEVVEVLNEYFTLVTDAIFKNKGTLDKFIGDAAMAVFNSPFDLDDYVYRAVCTARDIAKGSEIINKNLMGRYGRSISYGIGVNCGEATIGNIGSPFRMDYTAIGDTVNTAARLESNASAGTILISDEVKKRLADRIITEEQGEIPLKGKSVGIMVHKLIDVVC
ncbi:MAG: CHASE2 domain-containing protein [Lachnospiraceae bacterium]|nr:CHASE2 domain-containing protein [Lachnospiraceae bacterium]